MSRPTRPVGNRVCVGDGSYEFESCTSPESFKPGAHGVIPPEKIIPVILVPGIMGSNVRLTQEGAGKVKREMEADGKGKDFSDESWRPPNVMYSYLELGSVLTKESTVIWDSEPVKVAKRWDSYGPKFRQMMLDPTMTEVDDRGFLEAPEHLESPISKWYPKLKDPNNEARRRGWGTVHWDSYGDFLMYLESVFTNVEKMRGLYPESNEERDARNAAFNEYYKEQNGNILTGVEYKPEYGTPNPPYSKLKEKSPLPGNLWPTKQEAKNALKFQFPVHAVGYNWTQSNRTSAQNLLKKIDEFMGAYKKAGFACEQVILISHSMGGLVSRVAQKLDKSNRILGIIHGVMPAIGAPLAYRRMVAGMEGGGNNKAGNVAKLDLMNVFDTLAGRSTYETTPVMANAPGALELLPSHLYPSGWLKIQQLIPYKTIFSLPTGNDPYTEIYKEKNAWYRMVNPRLLDPAEKYGRKLKNEGAADKAWESYSKRVDLVKEVHHNFLGQNDYHKNTFVYYGDGLSSFATVRWHLDRNAGLYTKEELLRATQRRELSGGHGQREIRIERTQKPQGDEALEITSAQVQFHDATGDGTVPVTSGEAPGKAVSNICRLNGFDHQGSYGNELARDFTLLGVVKLTSLSKQAQEPS